MTPLPLTECLAGLHNEALNVAMCEERGWKRVRIHEWIDGVRTPKEWTNAEELPSHILGPTALHNCHEAEGELSEEARLAYAENLKRITNCLSRYLLWPLLHASVLHRVIAYLRVKRPEMFTEK